MTRIRIPARRGHKHAAAELLSDSLTAGDILYVDSNGDLVLLPAGSNGEVLTLASGVPSWASAGGGVSALDDLSDVTITAAASGEYLRHNGTAWVDAALSISDDSSPTLGGNLDASSNSITGIADVETNILGVFDSTDTYELRLYTDDSYWYLERINTGAGPQALYTPGIEEIGIYASGSSSTPPVVGDTIYSFFSIYDDAGAQTLTYWGYLGDGHLQILNFNHGGDIVFGVEDSGGTARTPLTLDISGSLVQIGDNFDIQLGDNDQILFGDSNDAAIDFDGTNLVIMSGTLDTSSTSLITDNDTADEPGWKGTPQNIQNADYTLVLGDAGKQIYKASGGAGETITIPANASVAFPIGTIITIVNDGGGDLSIAITTDTLEKYGGSTGTQTLGDNNKAVIEKVTSTLWKYASTD